MSSCKWLALVVLAGAIALVLAGTVRGRDSGRPPGLLPPAPGSEGLVPPELDERGGQMPEAVEVEPYALAIAVREAIEAHRAGRLSEAIAAWSQLRLPPQTDAWRQVALGFAFFEDGEFEQAGEVLAEARAEDPENPVVYFGLGLTLLARAERADEWYDATGVEAMRLASWTAPDVQRTGSLYKLAAGMALERAVTLANRVELEAPLLPPAGLVPEWEEYLVPVPSPTVRDLLSAFGGEVFEGRSHLALGTLHMERGVLDHAERHLDRATALGEATGEAFRELGERYEAHGRQRDAMRAHLKAMSPDNSPAVQGQS